MFPILDKEAMPSVVCVKFMRIIGLRDLQVGCKTLRKLGGFADVGTCTNLIVF
jgi:hypothetical protein